jgi:hypothetical protein
MVQKSFRRFLKKTAKRSKKRAALSLCLRGGDKPAKEKTSF